MLAPQKVAAGHVMHSGASAPIAIGSTLPLSAMPAGTQVATRSPSVPGPSHEYKSGPSHEYKSGPSHEYKSGPSLEHKSAFCCKSEVHN